MACKDILLVEDDPAVTQMMQDVLELHGYTVSSAPDGREGIARLRDRPERPCVILLDMMMPRMNGWQFLDEQRGDPELCHIPVIVCSAYRESAKSVRASAILDKPVRLNALLNAVKAFCG